MPDSSDSEYLSDEVCTAGKTVSASVKSNTRCHPKTNQKKYPRRTLGRLTTAASHANYNQSKTLLDFYQKRKRAEGVSDICLDTEFPPEKLYKGESTSPSLTAFNKSPLNVTSDTAVPPSLTPSQDLTDTDMEAINSYLAKIDSKIEQVLIDNSSTKVLISDVSTKIDVMGATVASLRSEFNEHKQQTDANIAELRKRVAELETNLTMGVISNSPEGEKMVADLRNEIQSVRNNQNVVSSQVDQKVLDQLERLQQASIKNNIVIRGLETDSANLLPNVRKFLTDTFKITGQVTDARIRILPNQKTGSIFAKLDSWDTKQTIMRNKRKTLSGTKISINPELTANEQKTYDLLRDEARVLKKDGKKVLVRYNFLLVDNIRYHWSKDCNKLVISTVHR